MTASPARGPRRARLWRAGVKAESPAGLGYRMPAEWEPQRATWLAWPHHRGDWPGKFAPIPFVYAEIVRHLARAAFPSKPTAGLLGTPTVEIIVNDAAAEAAAHAILTDANVMPALEKRIAF